MAFDYYDTEAAQLLPLLRRCVKDMSKQPSKAQ